MNDSEGSIDDARWSGSEPRLVERIRDEILASPDQRITFARFMERALTEPDLGYYASSEIRPTRAGDFLTAPELHAFFGRCLARFVAASWKRAGSPARYLVREFGAGRGTLRASALAGLRIDAPVLGEAIEWQRVDLPGRSDTTDEPADVILANEYLDALPVHRLVQAEGLQEAHVGWRDGWFVEVLAEPSRPDLEIHLRTAGVRLLEGQRADVSLQAPRWMTEAARGISESGLLLVIDYGHEATELYGPRRKAGSLLTYREHRVSDDPFRAVGHTDLTAHVDISALDAAARGSGLELLGRTTQARFLADLGLGDMLARLGHDPSTDPAEYLEARAAVARLLDPRHLGAFEVLAWGRPSTGRRGRGPSAHGLPGFGAAI